MPLFDTSGYQNLSFWTLRAANQEFLGLLLSEFDTCPIRFIGLNSFSTESYRRVMQQAIRRSNIKDWRQVRVAYSNDQVALKAHKFWNNLILELNSPDLWEEILLNCNDEELLETQELQQQWQQHSPFSAYSCSALVYLIQVIIPGLERFISIAGTELQRKVKPTAQRLQQDYAQYIEELAGKVQEARDQLITSVIARIQFIANKGSEVTSFVFKLMQTIKPHYPEALPRVLPAHKDQINPGELKTLINYAFENASYSQRQQLASINLLQTDDNYVFEHKDSSCLIIPRCFDDIIAPNTKWRVFNFRKNRQAKITASNYFTSACGNYAIDSSTFAKKTCIASA